MSPHNAAPIFISDVSRFAELHRKPIPVKEEPANRIDIGRSTKWTVTTSSTSVHTGRHLSWNRVFELATKQTIDESTLKSVVVELYKVLVTGLDQTYYFPALEIAERRVHAAKKTTPTPSWVENLSAASEMRDISRTIEGVLRSLKDSDAATLDGVIATIDVQHCNKVHLVAVLRTLFIFRKNLPSWRLLRDRTRQKIESSGADASQLLAGLNVD